MPTTTTTKTTTTTAGGIARTVTVTTTVTTPAAAVDAADDFPRKVGDVTVEWLSALLGKEVASFETQVLDMGVLSDLGRLTLTYAAGADKGPEAIIVKVAKGIDSSRAQPSSPRASRPAGSAVSQPAARRHGRDGIRLLQEGARLLRVAAGSGAHALAKVPRDVQG